MEVMRPAGGGNGLPDGPIGHGSCITILGAVVGTSFTVHTCGCGRSGLIAHWDPIASHLIHGEVMPHEPPSPWSWPRINQHTAPNHVRAYPLLFLFSFL